MARSSTNMPRRLVNYNRVTNGDFESAPSFTAATTTNQRWIDGTAGGSTTTSTYAWSIATSSGSFAARFDSSVAYAGLGSMKLSTTATSSFLEVHKSLQDSAASRIASPYMIPVLPSTSYTGTYRMKTSLGSGTATNGAFVNFAEYTGVLGSQSSNNGTAVKTTTDWTLYTVTFTTNANTRFISPKLIIYGHQGTGTLIMDAWFDDVTLTPTTATVRTAVS